MPVMCRLPDSLTRKETKEINGQARLKIIHLSMASATEIKEPNSISGQPKRYR
jgi:hypothetical protein